jgi:hypothetical protein
LLAGGYDAVNRTGRFRCCGSPNIICRASHGTAWWRRLPRRHDGRAAEASTAEGSVAASGVASSGPASGVASSGPASGVASSEGLASGAPSSDPAFGVAGGAGLAGAGGSRSAGGALDGFGLRAGAGSGTSTAVGEQRKAAAALNGPTCWLCEQRRAGQTTRGGRRANRPRRPRRLRLACSTEGARTPGRRGAKAGRP